MARIQVVTAITLNGFLPEPAGTLVSWVRNYDLVDELVVYQLPFSAGQGISVLNTFRPQHWELHKTTSFSNGICRLIYRKSCKM